MPATKCPSCDHAHRLPPRRNATKYCVLNDPNHHVDKRLVGHRGLGVDGPADCPGCLGHETIETRSYGKRAGDYQLTCRDCRVTYHWSER